MVIYRKKIREGTVQGKSRDWSEDTKVRLRIWEKWKRIILLGTFFVLAIGIPWEIRAENAAVTFGSNYYTATDNETFPIGVYLNGDSKVGTYEVKISYDNRRLEYTGGGDSEENGVITLSGNGVNAQVKYMLKFQTRSGGTADIKIESAVIHTAGENEEECLVQYGLYCFLQCLSVPLVVNSHDHRDLFFKLCPHTLLSLSFLRHADLLIDTAHYFICCLYAESFCCPSPMLSHFPA